MDNREKTKTLILYICSELSENKNFGSTVLNKILYYIDRTIYLKTKKTLTCFKYIKQERGHTPQPKFFLDIRDELVKEGKAFLKEIDRFGFIQKKLIVKETPDMSTFSPLEQLIIDKTILSLKDYSATEISDLSHNELNWQIANLGEELPPYTFWLGGYSYNEKGIKEKSKIAI